MKEDILNSAKIKKIFKLNKRKSEMLVLLFQAMLEVGSGNLSKLSLSIHSRSQRSSVYRRIQRFFSSIELCCVECAKLIFEILEIGSDARVILILDRTYWMRGKTHLNFLYLSVFYKGYGIPLFFKILPDKKGHSSVSDRRELVEYFISVFGKERIDYIVADREFDGSEWLRYLQGLGVRYVQRLKDNTICMSNSRGKMVKAKALCRNIKPLERKFLGNRRVCKSKEYCSAVTVAKNRKGGVLLLAHSEDIKDPTYAYSFRWGIELGFRAMKTGGFNMEDTKLIKPERITTLYRIISILAAMAHKGGVLLASIKPITIRSHGRKSVSYIRLFLDFIKLSTIQHISVYKAIRLCFRQKLNPITPKLSCTLINR